MLKVLVCMLFVGFAIPMFVFAASEYESDENVAIGVIGTAGTGATYELSPSALFESEEDYGQDLYEFIYNRVKHEGVDNAVQRVLADRHISKEELLIVVPGANIGELLEKDSPAQKLDPARIAARRQAIPGDLAEELRLADLETLAKLDVEPTEIFSNGDESDSGFDLIVDLDIIETILFGRTESVLGGAGPGAPPGASVIGLGGEGAGRGPAGGAPGAGRRAPAPGGAAVSGAASAAGAPGVASAGAGAAAGAFGFSAEEAGVVCPLNNSFNAEVERLREAERAAAESAAGERAAIGADSAGGSDRRAGAGAGAGHDEAGRTEEGGKSGAETSVVPEPAGDWTRPLPCNNVFCLRVEAVYKTESAYLANENCIACHFEKINDAFKETLDHNLVPSKATGNLFEGPKCKRSLLGLKWNFILIPQPILTPPNDDLVPKGDFIKNFLDFLEKYYRIPNPDEEAARNVLNQIPEGTPQDTIIRRVRENAEAKKQEAAEAMEKSRLENEARNQAVQYQVLMQEIEAFNGYFESFLSLYEKLVDPRQADNPCNTLENKPTCS